MKIHKINAASLALAGAMLAMPVKAADIYVIANASFALTAEEVREVYIGNKEIAGGTKVIPMDNASLQIEFIEKGLKITGTKYNNIWTKKGFRDGLNPPPIKSGDSEVISVVLSTPGAVGYVSRVPAGVKVITKY